VSAIQRLPDPCRDPKGFARAVQRLESRPDAEVSPRARRLLRVLIRSGATNCHTITDTDTITTTK
jgi:hypothetical protein